MTRTGTGPAEKGILPIQTLRDRGAFLRVKGQGQRVSTQGFVLQWLPVPEEEGIGLGYTCAKRSFGNGVKVNRARRRLKAAWLEATRAMAAAGEPVPAQVWLVVVGKVPVLEMEFEFIVKDLRLALGQVAGKLSE